MLRQCLKPRATLQERTLCVMLLVTCRKSIAHKVRSYGFAFTGGGAAIGTPCATDAPLTPAAC